MTHRPINNNIWAKYQHSKPGFISNRISAFKIFNYFCRKSGYRPRDGHGHLLAHHQLAPVSDQRIETPGGRMEKVQQAVVVGLAQLPEATHRRDPIGVVAANQAQDEQTEGHPGGVTGKEGAEGVKKLIHVGESKHTVPLGVVISRGTISYACSLLQFSHAASAVSHPVAQPTENLRLTRST